MNIQQILENHKKWLNWILWPMSGGEVKKTCKTIKI